LRTFTFASVVGAAAIALAPAGSATAAETGAASCHLTMNAEPRLLATGENAEIFGVLRCSGSGVAVAGQTVTIYARTAGIRGLRVVATTTTHAGGEYATTATGVTADTVYYAAAAGIRSRSRTVRVAPLVTFRALNYPEGATLRTGARNKVTFAGTVFPADGGADVVLEREAKISNEEWIAIQVGRVSFNGGFVLVHRFLAPGDANLRVIVRPHGAFDVRGTSNTLSFQVSQAQNPNLELNTAADPVPYGEPVTLSGTIKAPSGTTVTLYSRPRSLVAAFTKVAETTSSGGRFRFELGPATASTSYYVTGAGLRSSNLFQGVKYRLQANPPAVTTVQAGNPLTFTGTVTPSPPGKDVYLERENAFGGGFHVVDAVPLEGSTYTIKYWFFGASRQVYRVRVPGDPNNQATGSAPFTIDVTPATGLLAPAPQPTLPQ
jgi:hypothetical protein